MNSTSNHSWHFFGLGEWRGPFTFSDVKQHTRRIPHAFLLAGGVNDDELRELLTYPKIGGLAIVSPKIGMASTNTLQKLLHLRELILCGPPITDAFLLGLTGLATLQSLTLVNAECTEVGVRTFLRALPKCKVYRGNKSSIYPAFDRLELQPFLNDDCVDIGE